MDRPLFEGAARYWVFSDEGNAYDRRIEEVLRPLFAEAIGRDVSPRDLMAMIVMVATSLASEAVLREGMRRRRAAHPPAKFSSNDDLDRMGSAP